MWCFAIAASIDATSKTTAVTIWTLARRGDRCIIAGRVATKPLMDLPFSSGSGVISSTVLSIQRGNMAFTLEMIFGGLCLFVEQEDADARGMFVLMPNMRMPGMEHEVLAAFDGGYLGDPNQVGVMHRVPLLNQRVRIIGILNGGTKQGLPSTMAPVSKFGGGPVRKEWTTMARPEGLLAARIELDLGVRAQTFGAEGLLDFDYGGGVERRRVQGLTSITVEVPDGIEHIDVAGIKLYPRDGQLSVGFFNVAGGRLADPPRTHQKGDPTPHFAAYYWMLGREGPIPRVAETTVFTGGSFSPALGASLLLAAAPGNGPQSKKPVARRTFITAMAAVAAIPVFGASTTTVGAASHGLGNLGVDPVICTAGGGCSESDPDCT